jgi:hypothetical protein
MIGAQRGAGGEDHAGRSCLVVRASTILSPGDTLGGFQIVNVIGFGGMAVVYRAEQLSLGRPVALKVLSPQLSGDANYRERFRREGHHAAALDHPNIVAVYDSGESEGRLYLAMRLVEGTTLGEQMHERGLSAEDTVDVLRPIAKALDVAHAARLVHRDVKPQNILLAENGHPYLADFGVAKGPQTHGLTAAGGFVGSLNYAAPEQILGQPTTAAGDIYSLTAVLYQCLTGQVPYPRETDAGVMHAHLNEPPPALPAGDTAESALSAVIARGMAKDPADRYPRAGELMDAAARVLGELPARRRHGIPAFPTRPSEANGASGRGASAEPRPRTPAPAETHGRAPEVAASKRPGGQTELISARERLEAQQKAEATTADRRRAPPLIPAEPARAHRRRWPLAAAGFVIMAAAALTAVLTISGGQSIRTVHGRLISLTYSSPWKLSAAASTADARLFTAPVVLTSSGATLSAGQLVSSAVIPGGVPPQLARLLQAPTYQSAAGLGPYTARRYEWTPSTGAHTLAFVLATQSADLAILCRGTARALADCVTVADTVTVSGTTIEAPGPNATLAKALAKDLRPASIARTGLSGLSATRLSDRAAAASHIALAETKAASTLATTTVPPRNRRATVAIIDALRSEASSWRALAQAADHNQRAQYATATIRLVAASYSVTAAAKTLDIEGFPTAPLNAITRSSLPPIPHPKTVTVVIPDDTVTTIVPTHKKPPTQIPTENATGLS